MPHAHQIAFSIFSRTRLHRRWSSLLRWRQTSSEEGAPRILATAAPACRPAFAGLLSVGSLKRMNASAPPRDAAPEPAAPGAAAASEARLLACGTAGCARSQPAQAPAPAHLQPLTRPRRPPPPAPACGWRPSTPRCPGERTPTSSTPSPPAPRTAPPSSACPATAPAPRSSSGPLSTFSRAPTRAPARGPGASQVPAQNRRVAKRGSRWTHLRYERI